MRSLVPGVWTPRRAGAGQTLCPAPIQGCTGRGREGGSSYPPSWTPTPAHGNALHISQHAFQFWVSWGPPPPAPANASTTTTLSWGWGRASQSPPPIPVLLQRPQHGLCHPEYLGSPPAVSWALSGPLHSLASSGTLRLPQPRRTSGHRGAVPWRPGPSPAVLHGLPLGPGRWGGPRCAPLGWLQEGPGEPAWLSPAARPISVLPFTRPLPSSPGFRPAPQLWSRGRRGHWTLSWTPAPSSHPV